MQTHWHRSRLVLAITAVVFASAALLASCKQDEQSPANKETATATSDDPWANAKRSTQVVGSTPVPEKPTAPNIGAAMAEAEPLLLIPTKLDGFEIALGNPLPRKVAVGAAASYYGKNKHLVAHVHVNQSEVKPDPPDDQRSLTRVGQHDAILVENRSGKTITIEWSVAGWHALVTVDYERTTDHAAAQKAVQIIAPQVGALLDLYTAGTPPSETERQQQLAAIGRTAVVNLVATLEREGVSNDIVVGAHQDEHTSQLLVVTVGPSWSKATKQDRRAAAKKLHAAWTNIRSPGEPETSSVKLVNDDGKTVGLVVGSNVTVE